MKERLVFIMKQLIVLVSMIMLGIAISGMISQFGDKAELMSTNVLTNLDSITPAVNASGSGNES